VERQLRQVLTRPDVIQARIWLETREGHTLATQRDLAMIPAPTGAEGRRADAVAERLRGAGLTVRVDEVGNVRADISPGRHPAVVLAAHLDTVFPADVPHEVAVRGQRLVGPGIGDNARGLAVMLALAHAWTACKLAPGQAVAFVATVGEEGAGDLRGVRHLFADEGFRPRAFVVLDGPGVDRVVHRAAGSVRVRARFSGPGGHSWAAFGVPNPAHAAGAAAAAVGKLRLPVEPRATASVVRIGGGTALNTIPSEAWIDLDVRAEDGATLERLEAEIAAACRRALDQENRRRAPGTPALSLDVAELGRRPTGVLDRAHPLVRAALAATRAVGAQPQLASASTDANVPLSLGLPAIALGAGGRGGDAHLPTEWYENTDGLAGILRALLVMLAVAEQGA
jgi:acetylornithine deacetylase/succinyl-diaminopimelate desuccinylase-like protein